MKTNIFKIISTSINSILLLDTMSKERLERLVGKVVTIELEPLNMVFQLSFSPTGVFIKPNHNLPTNTTISGTPLSLLSLALASEKKRFFAEDLKIVGDAELGQQVVALFDELSIDWEEYLSKWTGDTTAHYFGLIVRNANNWLKDVEDSFTQDLNEFVHEEINLFPPSAALEDFFNEVDQLRLATDRIEARIKAFLSTLHEAGELK